MWHELLIDVHYSSTMADHSSPEANEVKGRPTERREKETCNLPKELERVVAGFCFTLV